MTGGEVVIEARGLVKRYGPVDAAPAVAGVDVEVARGELFGFLGPNGAGKSSTMRMIACVSPRTGGDLRVLGLDPDVDGRRIRARLGVVPQEDTLDLELSVADNLYVYGRFFDLPRRELRARIPELLESVALADRADARVDELSGGMKRRLTIARAMVSDPELVLLDEPTTGLDPRSRLDMWDLMERLVAEGTTTILTTQYLEEADRLAHQIVVVDHGTVIARGTAEQLKDQVGGDRVTITLADEVTDEALLAALGPHAVPGARVRREGRAHSLPVRVGTNTPDVVHDLDGAGIRAVDVEITRPTLDDVFLTLTGHAAEEAPPVPEPSGRRSRRARGEEAAR